MQDRVGFIGLGRMGSALAERLVGIAPRLVVFDVDQGRIAPFVEQGATAARDPRDVADTAQIVFSCLPTSELSLEVAETAIAKGAAVEIYVDTGTIGRQTAEAITSALSPRVSFLDAPVSGGPNGARAGTLAAIVSGPAAAFGRAQPYFSAMAKEVFHIGERAGQAQIAKLINNHLSAAGRIAAFEGLVMAMKAGIDPMRLLDVVNAGTGRNHTTLEKIPAAVRSGEFAYGARLANSIKDEGLLADEASLLGVPLWLAPRLLETLRAAADAGYLDRDSMTLIQFMGEQAGIDARSILEASADRN